jgi:hypothetical protein
MRTRILLRGFAVAAGFLLANERSASAMAAPPCVGAKVFPSTTQATVVPANIPGFGYTALKATASDVHLFQTTGGPRLEVPLVATGPVEGFLKVAPTAALTPGQSYELEFKPFCNSSAPTGPLKFTAGPSAPIPTKIGNVQGTPIVSTKDFGTTQFTINANYTIDPEMKPWAAIYELAVVLDGRAVSTRPTINGDVVQVNGVGWCDATNGSKNDHTLQLRATLPFAPKLETAAATLNFSCPGPKITSPGNIPVPGPTGGTSSSGGGSGTTTTTPASTAPAASDSGGTFTCDVGRAPITGSTSGDGALIAIAIGLIAAGRRREHT